MNSEVERKIRSHYARSGSAGFQKFIDANPDVRAELEAMLESEPWFENIRNVFIAIGHDIHEPVRCAFCGKALKVESAIYGKHRYCCKRCADADPKAAELRKQTCLRKYGTSTPLLNEECRKKTIATCRRKFGSDMFAGSDEYKRRVPSPFRLKETHEKARKTKIAKYGEDYGKTMFERRKGAMMATNMEKYGVPFVLMSKRKRDETHDAMERRYGSRYYFMTQAIQDMRLDPGFDRIATWHEYVVPLFSREEYVGKGKKEYPWKCVKCGNVFRQRIYITGLGEDREVPRCERCFPDHGASIAEREILEFVESVYDGEVRHNVQTVLEGRQELDIWIPDRNVAIEFDGLYWHSERMISIEKRRNDARNYHLAKLEECLKNGIQLIHVFEDEWKCRKSIVMDRIRSILCAGQSVVFARKCTVREIDSNASNHFLEENHLQGADNAGIRYGLYHDGELVGVMTFGKPRFNCNYDWELIRFASKLGVRVVGGASKLLRAFLSTHAGKIVSYADRRYSNGKMYETIGFRRVGCSRPNYWYVKQGARLNRYSCQKHKLRKLLGERFDPSLSERDNMLNNGYDIIYDCGNLIYELP